MSYQLKEMQFAEFNSEIEMMNYSDKSKEFYLTIISPFFREGIEHFDIFTKDGKKATFRLNGVVIK